MLSSVDGVREGVRRAGRHGDGLRVPQHDFNEWSEFRRFAQWRPVGGSGELGGHAVEAGSLPLNRFGLRKLHGNALEW